MALQNDGLTRSQIRHFKEQGFIKVESVLTDREVAYFLSRLGRRNLRKGGDQTLARHKTETLWRQLVSHARIVGPLRDLLKGAPCVVQSMLAYKERAKIGQPARNGIALHQDHRYIKTEPAGLIGCWVALNDTDEGNGGFRVVPGSHRKGLRENRRTRKGGHRSHSVIQHMRNQSGDEWYEAVDTFALSGIDPEKAVALEVPKGTAVFFDGFLVHGSQSNNSCQRERIALALHYVREGTWVYRMDLHEVFPVRRSIRALGRQSRKAHAKRDRRRDRIGSVKKRMAGRVQRKSNSRPE